jgi:hypothetical protein
MVDVWHDVSDVKPSISTGITDIYAQWIAAFSPPRGTMASSPVAVTVPLPTVRHLEELSLWTLFQPLIFGGAHSEERKMYRLLLSSCLYAPRLESPRCSPVKGVGRLYEQQVNAGLC